MINQRYQEYDTGISLMTVSEMGSDPSDFRKVFLQSSLWRISAAGHQICK